MKLGLELYRNQLNGKSYRLAQQLGCEHLVLQLVADSPTTDGRLEEVASVGGYSGTERGMGSEEIWTYESLARLTETINAAGLQVEAVGGSGPIFPPGDRPSSVDIRRWRDRFKALIRTVGGAGIPVLGYEVNAPRMASGRQVRVGRGDAHAPFQDRWKKVLDDVLPVAEEAGVILAAQVRPPAWYRRIMDLHPCAHHALEFCVADMAALAGEDVYLELEACLRAKRLACLRLGNFPSEWPSHETSADAGRADIPRLVRILRLGGYRGVVLPGCPPRMDDAAPGHAEMAHALGELRAAWQQDESAG